MLSCMLKLFAETVVTLPEITKLPVTVTSPEIVPPVELNLVLAVLNAAAAFSAVVLANVYAEFAYEPADSAFVAAVLA